MMAPVDQRLATMLNRAGLAAAGLVAVAAFLALVGWALDLPLLRTTFYVSAYTPATPMNPLTSVGFLSAAWSVWLWQQQRPPALRKFGAIALGAVAALVGLTRLLSYHAAWDMHLDQILFSSRLAGNRIAPNTAFGFVLAGSALCLLESPIRNRFWPTLTPALTLAGLSLLALTGYLQHSLGLFGVKGQIPMAFNTASCFAAVSFALLCLRPARAPMNILISSGADGEVARRLLPAVILVPLAIGVLRIFGEVHGIYSPDFGAALATMLITVTFVLVVWSCTRALRRADLARRRAQLLLERRNTQLLVSIEAEKEAILALKAAQGQLIQSEKLASLGQMVAGVAHEINNPLSFVANNVAVLQRDIAALCELLELYRGSDDSIAAEDPAMAARIHEVCERVDVAYTLPHLDQILTRSREGLKRIQQIVKDLRDFARLDESDLHAVSLNDGIESTITLVKGRADSKNVELVTHLGSLPKVTCYPAKINQVILNLLSNAIDASKDGGRVEISSASSANEVSFAVRDNGSGIDPGVREKIFDPFFTTKPQGQGTGLGLSISYGIIRDHGGSIEVETEPGKGSCFTVHLPLETLTTKEAPHVHAGLQ